MSTAPGIEETGYKKSPKSTRFRRGQSRNPRGRPKNRRREIPYDAFLGQMVTMRSAGRKMSITAAEAFILQLTQKGLAGDSAAVRASLGAIKAARAVRGDDVPRIDMIIMTPLAIGADVILKVLSIATKKYPKVQNRVPWELNPWIVEAALDRLDGRQLSTGEQCEVWNATRTHHKVSWPECWEVKECPLRALITVIRRQSELT